LLHCPEGLDDACGSRGAAAVRPRWGVCLRVAVRDEGLYEEAAFGRPMIASPLRVATRRSAWRALAAHCCTCRTRCVISVHSDVVAR
jgi:hypothetical protein